MGVAEYVRARDALLGFDPATRLVDACDAIARAARHIIPFSMCAVLTTDPETLLPSGGVVEGFSPTDCLPFWDNELLDPDFNKFADLARRHDTLATLSESVEGDLHRSPRYLKMYSLVDASDEMRMAFVAGGSCLAVAAFVRCDGQTYTPEESTDMRALLPVATSLVKQSRGQIVASAQAHPPVVVALDRHCRITSTSTGAQEILEDLKVTGERDYSGLLEVAAAKALASRLNANLTTRVWGQSGRLYRLHVSPMDDEDGSIVVTVETGRPDDLALALLDSYDLTHRETEIALLLCRGLAAKEIANEMTISIHTVRDHVKAVYDKAGVSSRGELAAALFSNHIVDRLDTTVSHIA